MRQIVLGLDLGRHLGWALVSHQGGKDATVIGYGDIDLGKAEDERYLSLMSMLRMREYGEVTRRRFAGSLLDGVCFEDVQFFRGGPASKQNAGYRAIVMASCCDANLPFAGVDTATLKKFALKGNATKEEMIEAARHLVRKLQDEEGQLNVPQLTDNSADAIHCAMFGATRMRF